MSLGAIEGAAALGRRSTIGGASMATSRWAAFAVRILVAASLAFASACSRGDTELYVEPGPALWRVSDQDSVVWLFGTVHVLPEGARWRSRRIAAAFAASEVVYLETETDEAAAATIARLLEAQGTLAPGIALTDRLSGSEARRLAALAAELDIPIAALERMRPWRAALTLSTTFLDRQGHSADAGVERTLEAEAAAQGKRTAYLETAERQIAVFTGLSHEAELAFLSASMRQIEQEGDQSERLDELWRRGETQALGALLTRMIEEAGPDIADALIHDRNAAWVEDIDAVMRGRGEAFVAVGAAHMIGPQGLPQRMAALGYRVEGP